MLKWFSSVFGAAVVVITAIVAINAVLTAENRRQAEEIRRLADEKAELIEFARRLCDTRRVAQFEIVRQSTDPAGRVASTLLWQEIAPDGTLGRPIALEALGRQVYIESLVLKFEPDRLRTGDGEAGRSLALFRRVFGDQQPAEAGSEIDRAARPRLRDESRADTFDRLWEKFWQMVDDPAVAARYGVRVAQVEAPSVRVATGQLWEVSLDAAGGTNLRLHTTGARPTSAP